MLNIRHPLERGTVNGVSSPEFETVAKVFTENFKQRNEVGASLCVHIKGEKVLDLWGGMASREDPWRENTLCPIFSCSKAATAMCAHLLIERGLLKLNEKVSYYWPEFAQNGKEAITVAMMLNHSSAVPALRATVKPDGFLDWPYMVARLAAEKPFGHRGPIMDTT